MKIAIVYDRVNKFGGAERVLLTLHEMFPDAPLFTSVYSPEKAGWAKVFPEVKTSFLNRIKFLQDKHEFLAIFMPFVFASFNFENYDLVISVTSEFAKNINAKNGKHICYCLTPTRYLWSGYEEYFDDTILKFVTRPLINYLRKVDKEAAKKPDVMIAISTEVQDRVKTFYHRKSVIIYPPVDIAKKNKQSLRGFAGKKYYKSGYYLIVSRLVKYKKVDLVIEAFNEIGLPLLVVGTGREEKRLREMANSNINFLGHITDAKLAEVYKNARALIFPQEEDFGIVAVEAGMFGVPIIAYKKGGVIDIVNKNTGVFFGKQTKESLIGGINKFEKTKFDSRIIKKNAKRFSKKRFKEELLQVVKSL